MAGIKIITDSTAYLSEKLIKELDITVVPLLISFRGENYPEGSRYSNLDFFNMLAESPVLPTTSQPPAGAFVQAYKKLFADGADEIVGIFISSGLSGTYNSALTAAAMVDSDRIHLFDSAFTVNVQSYMVEQAANMATAGKSAEEILAALDNIRRNNMNLYFVVQSLDNLRKGGRIGGAASLIGTLLQVKPILYIPEGKIDLFDKVRTKTKALARVNELLAKSLENGERHRISVMHVVAQADAEQWAEELRQKYPGQEVEVVEAGQVIGVHAGAGTMGLCFHPLLNLND